MLLLPVPAAGRWITMGGLIVGIVPIPGQASRIVREWTLREKVNVTCPQCGLSCQDSDASHCKASGHVIYQEYDSRV